MLHLNDLVLVVGLILCPKDTPTDVGFVYLAPQLHAVAVAWELRADCPDSWLADPENFLWRLNDIRNWREQLAGAPPLADGARFPDEEYCRGVMQLTRQYITLLEQKQASDSDCHWMDWETVLAEARLVHRIWDHALGAGCKGYSLESRRLWMKVLRDELLGPRAYYSMDLPPPIPLYVWKR